MKHFTRSVVLALVCGLTLLASAFANENPNTLVFPVNVYANWHGTVQVGNTSTGSQTILVSITGVSNGGSGQLFNPLTGTGLVPLIVDTEAVTPTAITCGISPPTGVNVPNPAMLCNVTASFSYVHGNNSPVSSNDSGLQEAINDACKYGGLIILDGSSGVTSAQLVAATGCSNVGIKDNRAGGPQYWTLQPSTLTALATPTPRVGTASAACTGSNTVCDGTAVGTWTNAAVYFCVTYVDILGGESPCSTTAHYTTAGSLALNFLSPAASTGAVGWRAYAGASYATAYQLPITSANCVLSTAETVLAACAMGATGVFPTPTTHTQLPPQAGGVAAQYNPNTQGHTTFAYAPTAQPELGFQTNFGPFLTSGALTGGQAVVLGTAALPAAFLNYIGKTLHISGNISLTPTTGGTIQVLTGIGDITDFSTGTPKTVCTETETTATGTAAIKVHFDCTWTVNATGTTGSIMPGGFLLEQLQAGTTTGNLAVESATAAITTDVLDQDSIFIEWLQTSAAETGGVQLLDLHVETL